MPEDERGQDAEVFIDKDFSGDIWLPDGTKEIIICTPEEDQIFVLTETKQK